MKSITVKDLKIFDKICIGIFVLAFDIMVYYGWQQIFEYNTCYIKDMETNETIKQICWGTGSTMPMILTFMALTFTSYFIYSIIILMQENES